MCLLYNLVFGRGGQVRSISIMEYIIRKYHRSTSQNTGSDHPSQKSQTTRVGIIIIIIIVIVI